MKEKYRDILVKQIKDVGQELIERADEMVAVDLDAITDFNIHINLPPIMDEIPTIEWTTSTLSKKIIDRLCNKSHDDISTDKEENEDA